MPIKKPEEKDEAWVRISLNVDIPLENLRDTIKKATGTDTTELNEVSLWSMADTSVKFTAESALTAIFGKVEVSLIK